MVIKGGKRMNYMKEVAQMLGVELEEEFKLKKCDDYIFKITKDGLRWQYDNGWQRSAFTLEEILLGNTEIIKKPILDDVEKRYLSNVIKPFRNIIEYIAKYNDDREYISITYKDLNGGTFSMAFPSYDDGTMYKGMELDKKYTLEDLGL